MVDAANAKSVFLAALEKPNAIERASFLDQACAGDAELRARVEELLTAHESGSFPDFLAEAAPAFEATQSVISTPNDPTQTSDGTRTDGEISLSFLSPPRDPANLGRLDHYEVQAVIGQGGMGIVLKAFDESLDRIVAIKVLGSQYAANGTARKRFIREAKAIAAVAHENVVHVYKVEERVPYLVMQYIQGVSLQDRIDRAGPLELKEILRIGMQIASGLAAAHAQGIVHRDIKPSNILLENGIERVKLTDFGLARAIDDASVTQSGVIAGTPMYMSPEQARGEQVDPRSDLFSLGSVLYAMCTGHAPFRASGTMAVMKRVIEDSPRPICEQNRDIPDWLEGIVFKLLEKRPQERFATAKEVAALLEQHLAHLQQPSVVAMPPRIEPARRKAPPPPPRRKKHGWIVPLVVAIVLMFTCVPVVLISGLWFFWARGTDAPSMSPETMMGGRMGPDDFVVRPAMRADSSLMVSVDDEDLRIDVESQRGESYKPPVAAREYRFNLPPGRYHVRAYRRANPWTLVFQEWVSLADGESKIIQVDSSWTQLFNGKDIAGWKTLPDDRGEWSVADGALTGRSENPTHLFTGQEDFQDFHLRVVMRVKDHSTGIGFRSPRQLHAFNLFPLGYRVFVNGGTRDTLTGSLYSYPKEARIAGPLKEEAKHNTRFTLEVIARGDRLITRVDGKTTADTTDAEHRRGGIALTGGDGVEYQKVEIKALTPGSKSAAIADELQKFQGQWESRAGEEGGKEVPVQDLVKFLGTATVTGDQWKINVHGQPVVATIHIDPTKEPKEIDFVLTSAPKEMIGARVRGIYQFVGNVLNLCVNPVGERPKEFVTKPKSDALMIVAYRKAVKDEDRLQGAWRAVGGEFAGAKLTKEELELGRLVFTGDHLRATLPPKGLVGEGTFTLNPTASPKQITVKATTENNQALEGIYRFDGDQLVVCIGGGKDRRPREFKTEVGKSYGMLVLERELADGFVSLFNGKDLKGWVAQEEKDALPGRAWEVLDGMLIARGLPKGYLRTEKSFGEYVLELECQASNSFTADQRTLAGALLLQLPAPDPGYEKRSGLFLQITPGGVAKDILVPFGTFQGRWDPKIVNWRWFKPDWNKLRIEAVKGRLTIWLNGETICTLDGFTPEKSHFAIMSWGTGMRYRNIRIKELPSEITDQQRLQGSWKVVAAEEDGQKWPAAWIPSPADMSLTLTGDKVKMKLSRPQGVKKGEEKTRTWDGVVHLDPTANPRRINIFVPGDNKNSMIGIYRFEGDRLIVCYVADPTKLDYPTAFATRKGDGLVMLTLERFEAKDSTPFALTPPQVLQQMLGTWDVELSQKVIATPPKTTTHRGKLVIVPIAGGRFNRMRMVTDNGGPDDLQILGFDRESWEFRGMYFDGKGDVFGPSVGRFDAATRTLTSASQPENGVIRVRNTRFPGPDTIEYDVVYRDQEGKTILERRATLRRSSTPASIDESASVDVPKEMSLVDRLVGTWEVDMSSKVRPADKWKTEIVGRKVLGGRFIETRERILPSGEENFSLTTYDPKKKAFRQWYVSSRWPEAEGTATWDETAKTMTWACEGGKGTMNPIKTSLVWKFVADDKTEFHIIVKDRDGKVLEEIEGTQKRRPADKK